MIAARKCSNCNNFITCHGTEYRYINCEGCSPLETNICFDCYRNGDRCSTPNHELRVAIQDHGSGEQSTQALPDTSDLFAIESGCSEEADPLLALVRPDSMPSGWFRCIYFPSTSAHTDVLECELREEQYRRATRPRELAVVHPPNPPLNEVKSTIRCNNELMEVSEKLYDLLSVLKQLPFKRFWFADFCLAEPLQSSPPIPLEAICALAGRLTDNHIFFGQALPKSDTSGIPATVKLLRLVRFDRFGTPVLHCREARTDTKPVFHARMVVRKKRQPIAGTVFVNGIVKGASHDVVRFFRRCICQVDKTKRPNFPGSSRNEQQDQEKKISATCPIHGDAEFFIPELCLDILNDPENADEQPVWTWIRENAATTQNEPDTSCSAVYAPLDVGEIRLLRFFPFRLGKKGNVDVPIATVTHKLDEAPKFTALSYCWGSSTRDCLLPILTGETVNVTQHLGQIIQHLVASGITNVWIDQICIDQDNLDEKAVQVAQMLQIYRAADEVLIHLGPLPEPDKTIRFVQNIAPRCRLQGVTPENFHTALSEEDLQCWYAFRAARSSPWFSRTWIVQEMSVNPRTSVLLGTERVSWDDFLLADSLRGERLFYSDMPTDIVGIYSTPIFARIRKQLQQKGGYDAVNLFEVLALTRFLSASEPKDKIYAFMGLFDESSVNKWLPWPDYRREVADVYTSFAVAYALNGYTLHLLPLAGTSQTCQNHHASMPSWVPDWSFGNVLFRSLRENRAFEHDQSGFSSGTAFEGSANPSSIPTGNVFDRPADDHGYTIDLPGRRKSLGDFSDKDQKRDWRMSMMDNVVLPFINIIKANSDDSRASIVVKTALVDEIVGLTRLHLFEELLRTQADDLELQRPAEALLEINEEALELVTTHIDAEDRASRLARTLIADTWKEKDENNLAQVHHQWLEKLRKVKKGVQPDESSDVPDTSRYAGRVRQTFQNRVFGVTKGRRMGIFPSTTSPGDRVGIVAGLDLPCVFSERSQGFALVGEAYVEGVMYGEFEEAEESQFQELKIV